MNMSSYPGGGKWSGSGLNKRQKGYDLKLKKTCGMSWKWKKNIISHVSLRYKLHKDACEKLVDLLASNRHADKLFQYIKVHMATRWTIRHGLMLLWFTDLMNVTKEVTIHRPNVLTLLSGAFIRGDSPQNFLNDNNLN